MLEQLSGYLERDLEARRKLKAALIYPTVVAVVSIATVLILTIFVLPKFKEFFASLDATLPLPTRMLLALSDFLGVWWWAIVAVFIALILGYVFWVRTVGGRRIRDRILLDVPILGVTIRYAIIERFTRLLASMVSAGVPLPEAMRVTTGSLRNLVFEEALVKARKQMIEGAGLATPTAATGSGTPKGWNPTDASTLPPAIPHACSSPLDSAAANSGAMFVFGGDSRLTLNKGDMEICGQYYSHRLPIAIYGAKTGAGPETATASTPGTNSTDTAGDITFKNPSGSASSADSNASTTTADTTAASATVTSERTASVTIEGFAPPDAVPAHSILTGAELVVVHRDNKQSGGKAKSIKLTVTPNPGTGAPLGPVDVNTYEDPASGGSFHTDKVDITTALAPQIYAHGLSDLSVKYSVTMGKNDVTTEYLDSIQLLLTWDPPALRPIRSSDCTYRNSGTCHILEAPTNNLHSLYVMGTTYVPQATVKLMLNNAATEVFRSGLVVWSATLDINPNLALRVRSSRCRT